MALTLQVDSTVHIPLVVGFGARPLAGTPVLATSPTEVVALIGPEGHPLADAALALLGEGLPGVRVAWLGESFLTAEEKRQALTGQLPLLVDSPDGYAGLVLAGVPWVDSGVDFLRTTLELLPVYLGMEALPPVFVRAFIREPNEPDGPVATSGELSLQLARITQHATELYPRFPDAPLAFAVASSSLSPWGAYCGSGSLIQGLRHAPRPPVAGRPLPGQDTGFPFRLSSTGPFPVQDLTQKGLAVLDTDDSGAYVWASAWALNAPSGIGPYTALRLQDLIGSLKQLAEDTLLGQPLTLDRRAVFERAARELVDREASAFARRVVVRFAYQLTGVAVDLELHVPYEVLRVTVTARIGG